MLFTLVAAAGALLAASDAQAAVNETHWVGPLPLEDATAGLQNGFAMNVQGNGVGVWTNDSQLLAAFYSARSGWERPIRLDADKEFAFQLQTPSVAIDEVGNAAAAWLLTFSDSLNGTEWAEAYVAVYTPGVGWAAEHLLGPSDYLMGDTPMVAVGAGGRVFVTYLDNADPATLVQRVAVHVPFDGWQPTVDLMAQDGNGTAAYGRVAADEQFAVAAWDLISGGDGVGAYAATFSFDALGSPAWSAPYRFPTPNTGVGMSDLDMVGGMVRALVITGGFTVDRSVSLYNWTPAGGWEGGAAITPTNITLARTQLAPDPGGNMTVTWSQNSPTGGRDLWGRYFGAATGWGDPTLLEQFAGRVQGRQAAPDKNGGVLIVFALEVGSEWTVQWTRYVPGSGWRGTQVIMTSTPDDDIFGLVLGSSPEAALAMWVSLVNGTSTLQSYAIERDNVLPVVSNFSPASGAILNISEVLFYGGADSRWRVHLDGEPIAVQPWGAFGTSRTLGDGQHSYMLTVVDDDMNTFVLLGLFTVDTVSRLDVLSPPDFFETDAVVVGIVGEAEPGSSVTVNGAPVGVAGNGSFTFVSILVFGTNVYDIVAVDPAGNRANETLLVRQVLPDLGVDEAKAQIANLTANLSVAEVELAAAQAALALVRADANASAGDLAAAQVRLARAEGNVSALEAQLAAAHAAAQEASSRAEGANSMAVLGLVMGIAGVAVGVVALLRGGRGGAAQRGWDPPKKKEIVGTAEPGDLMGKSP